MAVRFFICFCLFEDFGQLGWATGASSMGSAGGGVPSNMRALPCGRQTLSRRPHAPAPAHSPPAPAHYPAPASPASPASPATPASSAPPPLSSLLPPPSSCSCSCYCSTTPPAAPHATRRTPPSPHPTHDAPGPSASPSAQVRPRWPIGQRDVRSTTQQQQLSKRKNGQQAKASSDQPKRAKGAK